jgi:ketosteroid isomerase-like protein
MFCDLVGSTALSSRLDPEELREVIGVYHACLGAETTCLQPTPVAMLLAPLSKFRAEGEKQMPEQSPAQLINAWVTAAQAKDANKVAGYYTNNAVLCTTPDAFTQTGIVIGQSNIEQDYASNFQIGWALTGISNQSVNPGTHPDWNWAYGNWSGTVPNPPPNGPTLQLQGSWGILLVNQGAGGQPNWLIQQHAIVTNPPSS